MTHTILTCLTPPGKAAIATLAVCGPRAWDLTRRLFQPRKGALADEPVVGRFWLGRLGADCRDEVILAVKAGRACPILEIHCHGGVEVVRMIQELYQQEGVQIVSWQQFLHDCYPRPLCEGERGETGPHPQPLSQGARGETGPHLQPLSQGARGETGRHLHPAILALLAQAPTTRTAAILLDQAHGAWQQALAQIRGATPNRMVHRLYELIPLGQHLVAPWRVVIAGAPNVGKSSLMNALAGYTRSIVSPIPGTTRDVVTNRLAIDGWPIEMTDTAGLRQATSDLEHQGIERARAVLQSADLRIWLLDGSTEPVFPGDANGWCFVINKTDLPAAWDWQQGAGGLQISAQSQAGLPELCDTISRRLVPLPPSPGEAVPCLPEQIEWVRTQVAAKEQGDGLA